MNNKFVEFETDDKPRVTLREPTQNNHLTA